MNTIYICSISKMNREGFISYFCSYEVTGGIQLINFEIFGDTEYNSVMLFNMRSSAGIFCEREKFTR